MVDSSPLRVAQLEKSGFLTLTYEDNPVTLVPDDLRDFWKRLRRSLSLVGRKIKYFACGEYGRNWRPHYHAIVFGLAPNTVDRALVNRMWKHGRTSVDYVNESTINYVCGYVMKKYDKEKNRREYTIKKLLPPFQRCSRGLGLDYALSHFEELSRQLSVRLFTGREVPLPRYFVKKLGIDSEKLKEKGVDKLLVFVKQVFDRAKVDRMEPTPENLAYLMFKTRDFALSDRVNQAFDEICEQRKNNYESLSKLKS